MSYLPQTEDIRLSTNDTKTTESEGSDAQAGVNAVNEENIQEGDLLSIASTGMEGDSSANLMNGSADTFSVPTTRSEIGKSISDRRVIPFPQKSYFHDSFVSLQKWEGVVLSLGEDTFTAKLVDSTDTSRPAEITVLALEYLRGIGVDPAESVKMIVVTHWHDDHIQGVAETLKECKEALFVCSTAQRSDEFLALVYLHDENRMLGRIPSGVSEFRQVLDILDNSPPSRLRWATELRIIMHFARSSGSNVTI